MNPEPVPILLVEDNEDDVFLMKRALQRVDLPFVLQLARNGQEAIQYLSGEAPFADRSRYPLPQIVFLDLKLPLVHGFDFLAWLRRHPVFHKTPVAILTSSSEEKDRQKARALGAQLYLVKPPAIAELRQTLQNSRPQA
jgi:CheY-like chemotaxis protein